MAGTTSVAEPLDAPEQMPPNGAGKRKTPLWAKACVGIGAVLLVASTATYASTKYVGHTVESSVKRANLLGDSVKALEVDTRGSNVHGPMTFLVIGSDSRAGNNLDPKLNHGNAPEGQRSDTIIVGYVPKSMDRAYMISFPRDSFVEIANERGTGFGWKNKLNSAFTGSDGAARLVKTINHMTGTKIDYPVIVDFNAVRKITDLVGGVDVVIDKDAVDGYRFMPDKRYPTTPCRDPNGKRQNCLTFHKGPLHLDGQLAEYYVRQRLGLARGDLDRAQRQQQYMRALITKVSGGDTLTSPTKFTGLVKAVAESLTVDNSMNVMDIAFALKNLRSTDLTFLTIPVQGMGNEPGAGSVVYPDMAKTRELFAALNNGTLDAWIVRNGANDVSHGL
jgi:LCP family protein required for cell wall assembly